MIKFTDIKESKLFITGCTHLNHNPNWPTPIWEMRGYKSHVEMTDGIIDKINEDCRNTDMLLVLGDFCLNTSFEQFQDFVKRIKPRIWMLEGNHPNPWLKRYKEYCFNKWGHLAIGEMWEDIVYLGHYVELKWNKRSFVCNHYPYWVFDGMAKNVHSLCSHSHGSCDLSRPEDKRMKQLDCGWDLHKKPLDFKEIMSIMDKKGREFLPDHHDRETNGGF